MVFENCIVLLCNVHTVRYFRDKVFTSKAFWGEANAKNYLVSDDKNRLEELVRQIRDAPSEEIYREREEALPEATKDLIVRPGQSNNPVSFLHYYQKNWKNIAFRWVLVYRKNLPLNGARDTQAAESTFSSIKRFIKSNFKGTPSMAELVSKLPKFLDSRSEERIYNTEFREVQYNHPDPEAKKALVEASKKLNIGGMKQFVKEINMADDKGDYITLEGNIIKETYKGKASSSYIGIYETDGYKCNCSWNKSYRLCHPLIVYRKSNNLSLFDLNMFN